jgi:hypothetical protein
MSNIITIDQIQEGMIVAEPILNNFGQVLISPGVILQEKHKNILKTWNIKAICIKSDESDEEVEISEELRSLAVERLNKRMIWEPRNAIENNLYQIGILQTAKNILKKKNRDKSGHN